MKVHILQNSEVEEPGSILNWADNNHIDVVIHKIFKGDPYPALEEVEAMIVLGAPFSANDKSISWLATQRHYLMKALDRKIRILGICLGGQLLAQSQGTMISPSRQKEIGWFPVHFDFSKCLGPLNVLDNQKIELFQFHGEEFMSQQNSVSFASSDLCDNQCVEINKTSLAFTSHIEINEELVTKYLDAFKNQLDGVQLNNLKEDLKFKIHESQQFLNRILMTWLELNEE